MNGSALGRMTRMVAACWPSWKVPADDDEAGEVWRDLLGAFSEAVVSKAIKELAAEGEKFAPPPGIIRQRSIEVTRRAAAQDGAEAPAECEPCGGTGWVDAGFDHHGHHFVARCRCHVVRKEHRAGCSCLSCHYGPERSGVIRRGNDGRMVTRPSDPKRLALPKTVQPALIGGSE